MKKLLLSLLVLSMSQAASAAPVDSGAEAFSLRHFNTSVNDIFTLLLSREASFSNSFGIYDIANPGNTFTIFSGTDPQYTAKAIAWTNPNTVTDGVNSFTGISWSNFGFYINNGNQTFYSQNSKNGGNDHMIAETGTGWDYKLHWEDLPNPSANSDYNDIVIGVHDVKAVPLPAAVWMFGSALMGFLGLSRRKI